MSNRILWKRLAPPGHEFCRLAATPSGHRLVGTALFASDAGPCRLDYRIDCDAEWRTVAAEITGQTGERSVDLQIRVTPDRRWLLNGADCPAVAGCVDLDLAFSPATNILPIRRLGLAVGDSADVRAAWLRFPEFDFEPLDQTYAREGGTVYRYESDGGAFVRQLQVNPAGFVTGYPGLWEAETF